MQIWNLCTQPVRCAQIAR